jgi:predicted dehydrogenase
MCWASTQVYPIEAEDNAIGIIKYANGAVGQFEVSWTFRAGMDLRDEVTGTEGNIWFNNFSQNELEFSTAEKHGHSSERALLSNGWILPGGDGTNGLGYANMFTDMFNAIENKRVPLESFYDGYVVNAILDAAFASASTQKWEPVVLDDWRGDNTISNQVPLISYNDDFYLVKEEVLPNGDLKTILKNKTSGEMAQRLW